MKKRIVSSDEGTSKDRKVSKASGHIVTIDRKALASAMEASRPIAGGKHSIPIRGHVRLLAKRGQQIHVFANNGDMQLDCTLPNKATDAFDATVAWSLLEKMAKASRVGDVTLVDDEHRISGSCGTLHFGSSEPSTPEDFPMWNPGETVVVQEFPAEDLWLGLQGIRHAIGKDTTRPYFMGVYFDATKNGSIKLVATDGNRLAKQDTMAKPRSKWSAIMPTAAVNLLFNRLHKDDEPEMVEFVLAQDGVGQVTCGAYCLTFKTLDAQFPDYATILVTPTKCTLSATTSRLIDAIEKVIADGGRPKVALRVLPHANGKAITLSQTVEEMTTKATCVCSFKSKGKGKPVALGINPRFLLDALTAIGAETVVLTYDDDEGAVNGPVVITGDPNFVEYLMPMRL